MALKRVFEPIMIGNVEVPNRVVRTAHGTYLSSQRYIGGDRLIGYHLARAKGGVGLSILEASEVHPSCAHGVALWDERIIDSYRDLMAAIRPTGMRVFQQLWHGGHLYNAEGGGPPWGVSTVPSESGIVPIPMTKAHIEELQQAYVTAALRCREGGLDGVEFHCCHGYLPYQFLSPIINTRTDEYGGSLENRMRFLVETLRLIRKAVGSDFVVGVRMGAGPFAGITEEDVATVIRKIQDENLIDYLNASWGDYYYHDHITGGMNLPVGFQLPSSTKLTAVANVPRIVVGRFRTLEEVEQVIKDGAADMVSMVRAHIADPDIVRKTREGRVDEIRPCIACNQGCIGGLYRYGQVGCAVNVAVGAENDLAEDLITTAEQPRKVLVVGGGPGGMEAARVARLRGHQVKLVEASPNLGGTVNIAKLAPRLHTLGDITHWLEAEIYRLGVEVQLNSYFDADDVRAEAPDAVIIATGSMARMDGFQKRDPRATIRGHDLPHVLSSVDIMTQPRNQLKKSAVVFDDVGHFEAIAVAEYLIEKGLSVTFVTGEYTFGGKYVQTTERDVAALERLYQGDFRVMVRSKIHEIRAGECVVGPLQSKKTETVAADHVILVTPNEALRDLCEALNGAVSELHTIGDSNSPRDIQVAIKEGHLAARGL